MHVRPATLEDAEAITRIHIASWLAHYRGILPDEVLDGLSFEDRLAQRQKRLREPSPGVWNWVVEDRGALRGWGALGPARADDNGDLGDPAGELYAIYLDPSQVGQGYGRALWTRMLEVARAESDWTEIVLWVLTENALAQRFYRAAGFVEDERVAHQAHMGSRTLRMRRAL